MVVISVVVVYLLGMVAIGWYASKKIESNEDFMVAGRRLGPVMMAGTLAATEIGGGSSLGVVEKAYGSWGFSAVWYVLAMAVTFVILSFFAPKLRNAMVKTVPEYFRRRYGDAPGIITAIIMMLPLIGLTAAQFIASAVILEAMTLWSYSTCVLVVSVIVTVYAVLGGLWSVTLTDFIQMFLIVGGMFLAVPYALDAVGGWEVVKASMPAEKLSFTAGIGWGTIISLTIIYITSFAVGQEAVQRYYAAKDEKAAVQGSLIASGIYVIFAFIPVILGLIAFAMVEQGKMDPELMARGAKYALPSLAMATMPSVLAGFLFAGIISATMSSADSNMLGAGSIFANDIYRVYLHKNASDKQILRVTQMSMVVIGLAGLLIAWANTQSIIALLMFSMTLRAGGAFFPYIVGHYWKKASWAGVMASVIVGSTAVILVEQKLVSFFGLEPIFLGLASSAVVFVLFCNLFPNSENTVELKPE
ncbi:sodium:solute symporter family protein [Candidatus Uabimicrobium amorphum]|uniref:Sodium:solute symport protein n=1 Tax=Uabimicrobium amorphum TaxID=2596890 RepID=A0A5S9IQ37_UABAM|nr:sodium:solute symporter family protein [Candidatus Uabimicrobium amorphum]BBM84615.1 sodium:solute symport protein [Candidatus Uabimicrobium amorphum]